MRGPPRTPRSTPLGHSAQASYAELLEATRHNRDTSRIEALAKAAIALGCAATAPAHFRVVRRVNEIGFFRAGGLLVESHAFLAFGNALGLAWGDIARTQDHDFAHAANNVALALPATLNIDTPRTIESLEAGFLPLRVDFFAPMVGGKAAAFTHAALGVKLQPRRFLEFILEDVHQTVVLSAVGAVMANVPDPARYALHKLLVYAERRTTHATKARKDLREAAALLDVLWEFRRDDLRKLWRNILARNPAWRGRARTGFSALEALAPDLEAIGPLADALTGASSPRRRGSNHQK